MTRTTAMLRTIEITNFRCFPSLTVPLRPLTVLIGPNDSGKSAFLAAIRELAAGRRGAQIDRSNYWRRTGTEASVLADSDAGRLEGGSAARSVLEPLGDYSLPSQGVAFESDGVPDDGEAPQLRPDGSMVAALMDYLLRRDRPRFDAVVRALQGFIAGLERIDIATPLASSRRIDLVVERGFRVEPGMVSAGVRLLLFFVALAHHPTPPRLILIEEPENGIHPRRLADIVRLLREITEGKHGGRATQVIVTTHSPYLLDQIHPDRDQVLVFRRLDDGSRTAEPADEARLKQFLDEFMLGEVWFNQSEEGLVAKRS